MSATSTVVTDKVITDIPPKKNDNSEIIKKHEDIFALIEKIHASHSLLTVTINNEQAGYGSTILEINGEENYLVLDELNPLDGHEKIAIGSIIKVNTQHAGALVRFKVNIEAIGGDEDAAYYKAPLPERIEYHQRRNWFRVSIGINETVPVSLRTEDDVVISAELRDISVGGMALRINDCSHVKLREGDFIPSCVIKVSEQKQIMAALNICRVQNIKESGMLRIGVQFVKMNNTDIRELEHFVAEMQREMIKKLRRVKTG